MSEPQAATALRGHSGTLAQASVLSPGGKRKTEARFFPQPHPSLAHAAALSVDEAVE
jgi:hypothetical protein